MSHTHTENNLIDISGFVGSEVDMSDALNKLGDTGGRPEDKALSEAFHKFAVVIREHSQLLQQLVRWDAMCL